jgi:F-type H+-transporting ATPase subunit b
MLDLNSSIFWTFLLVCGLYVALTRIFFRPVAKVIDEREARTDSENERLRGMTAQVEGHARALESQMDQARKDAARIREEWARKGENVRAQAMAEAKEKAARFMKEKMTELETEVRAAEKALEKEIAVFSEKIRQAYL